MSNQSIQEHEENIGTTRVTIEPSYQSIIQSAVDFINQKDSSILSNVTDVIGHVEKGGLFGEYQTGSPHTVYVDIRNIEQKVKNAMQGASEEQVKNEIKNQIIQTLVHEATHMQEFSTTGYSSESGPEAAEKRIQQQFQPISCRDIKIIKG
jgi:hypothetical protein